MCCLLARPGKAIRVDPLLDGRAQGASVVSVLSGTMEPLIS